MAIPNLLVSKHKGQGNAAVFQLIGGTVLEQIGSAFTASLELPTDSTHANRVIEFKGKRFVWHRNEIREENTGGTGNWGVVYTVPNYSGNEGFGKHTGLFEIQVAGVPTLVGLHQRTSNSNLAAIESTDGTSWVQFDSTYPAGEPAVVSSAIVYRNQMYWRWRSTTNPVLKYDPVLNTGSLITVQNIVTGSSNNDFCVHNDQLFMVGSTGSGSADTFRLWQLQGSAFTQIHAFTTQDNGAAGEDGSCCLFSDGTDLFAILPGETATSEANAMYRIQDPAGGGQTVTDISATVLPARFRAGGANASDDNLWFCFVNNDSAPTSPEIYLWRLSNFDTGTYEAFQFVNFSTALTELASGPSHEIYMAEAKFGGGDRIDSVGTAKVYAELESFAEVIGGGVQFSYRVYGTGASKTATLYIDGGQEIPATQATLSGVATGGSSVRSGNTITAVTPDAGATLYTGVWAASTDGFSETDQLHLQLNLT
jgi:hypothetical protein